jgi:hypothetical protein
MATTTQPTFDEVAAWQRSLPTEYLQCRDFGHLWRPTTVHYDPADRTYTQTMRCGRCLTERDRTLSISGAILASQYHYVSGYSAPSGTGQLGTVGRDHLRLESVLRMIGNDEGPDNDA